MSTVRCACMSDMEYFEKDKTNVCFNKLCRFSGIGFKDEDLKYMDSVGVYLVKIEAHLIGACALKNRVIDLPICYPTKYIQQYNLDVAELKIKYYNSQSDKTFHGIVNGWMLSHVCSRRVF